MPIVTRPPTRRIPTLGTSRLNNGGCPFINDVLPEFFGIVGIPIIRGRSFTEQKRCLTPM